MACNRSAFADFCGAGLRHDSGCMRKCTYTGFGLELAP